MKRKVFLALTVIAFNFAKNAIAQKNILADFEPAYEQGKECALMEKVIDLGCDAINYLPAEHPTVRGFFPVRQLNSLQLVFWQYNPIPSVYLSVTFENEKLINPQVDSVPRRFTPLERSVFVMTNTVIRCHLHDSTVAEIPHCKYSVIPVVTAWGKKVYVFSRAKEKGTYLFGNDYEYSFDDNWSTFTRLRLHDHASIICSGKYKHRPDNVVAMHSHSGDSRQNVLTSGDFAAMLYYHSKADWDDFLIYDDQNGYTFRFKDHTLIKLNNTELRNLTKSSASANYLNSYILL